MGGKGVGSGIGATSFTWRWVGFGAANVLISVQQGTPAYLSVKNPPNASSSLPISLAPYCWNINVVLYATDSQSKLCFSEFLQR